MRHLGYKLPKVIRSYYIQICVVKNEETKKVTHTASDSPTFCIYSEKDA